MDGILTMKGFDTSLAEGVHAPDPVQNADSTDEAQPPPSSRSTRICTAKFPNQFAADAHDCVYCAYAQALEAAGATAPT